MSHTRRRAGRLPKGKLYVIARRWTREPELLRLPCGAGEALTVFSSRNASYSFLRALDGEWSVRPTSPGELASLLCALYATVGWVSLNPRPEPRSGHEAHRSLVDRATFVDYLLCGTTG